MTGFIADGQPLESPLQSAIPGYLDTPPTEGEQFGAAFGQSSITEMLLRKTQRDEVANRSFLEETPEPLSADEANKQYAPTGPDGNQVKITDQPIDPDVAKLIGKAKSDELDREGILERGSKASSGINNFSVGAAAFMADPINLASTFIPGIGEENILAGMGRVGLATEGLAARTAARAASGATTGAIGQIPLSALHYGLGQEEASDYALRDAFKDVAFGAASGAILHAGFGAIGDAWKARGARVSETPPSETGAEAQSVMDASAPTKAAAMKASVSQIVSGREVDPQMVISGNLPLLAEKQQQETQSGFSPSLTSADLEQGKQEVLPDTKANEPPKSRLAQPVIDRYKGTVKAEVNRLGIPLDDETINQVATSIAEQHNPEKPQVSANPKEEMGTLDIGSQLKQPPTVEAKPIENFPNLPKELSKGSPRYKQSELSFDSDVDKALYIVRERSSGKSKAHDKYMDYLKNDVGLTDEEISKGSEDVKSAVQSHAEGTEGKASIPKTFTKNPEVAAPDIAEEARHPVTGKTYDQSVEEAAKRPETINIDTPERKTLRDKIADEIYVSGAAKKDSVAHIVMGGPGAGKTTAVVGNLVKKSGALEIDPDMVKERLPEYDHGNGAVATHKESQLIARNGDNSILHKAVKNKDNIVLPVVGHDLDSLSKLIDGLKNNGYTVNVTHVGISGENSLSRIVDRFKKTGRSVPLDYARDANRKVDSVYEKIKENPNVSGHSHIDNNGSKPELIDSRNNPEVEGSFDSGGRGVGSSGADVAENAASGLAKPGERTEDAASQLTPEQAEIQSLQAKLNLSKMTNEERAEISGASQLADTLNADYQSKLKAWTDCLAGIV